MSISRNFVFAGVSLIALSTPAFAQTAATSSQPVAASAAAPGDIVVEARRRAERLQDVPKTVSVVTGADLEKNNVQKFEDIQNITAGVNLQNSGDGLVQKTTVRGTNFDVDSGLQSPTVQFYLNESNIQSSYVYEAMYDIGQVDVLKGPQGTLQGRSAPSGAITLTTKAPDLYKFGGYVDATVEGDPGGHKEDYALNVPVLPGKLAIRVAGTATDTDNTGVRPVNAALYPTGPYDRLWSERVSVRAQPIDALDINFMWQHMVNHDLAYLQTESTCLIDPTQPCGSGPLISQKQRLSTVNGQREVYQSHDIFNIRANLHLYGQKLSYVGMFAIQHLGDQEPLDYTDAIPGANPLAKYAFSRGLMQDHEIRLANEERIANILDYVVGWNTVDVKTYNNYTTGTVAVIHGPNQQYVGGNGPQESAFFGNLTVHPIPNLEISGGARYIIAKFLSSPSYSLPFAVGQRNTATIWTASASYHVTEDFMPYVNAGSSFRQGGTNLGFQYAPYSSYDYTPLDYPAIAAAYAPYYSIAPEKSTSIEVGFKSQFFNRKLTLNVDYFHQKFNGYQYTTDSYVSFLAPPQPVAPFPGAPVYPTGVLTLPIAYGTTNVPATVQGVEGDFNYNFNRDAGFGATASYVDGKVTGGAGVPCAGTAAQYATLTPANPVLLCVGGPLSHTPRFNAAFHADYAHPINNEITGFVRGQVSVYGATQFDPSVPYDKQPSYAIANVFVGVRAPDSAWSATLFVKNLFNDQTRLQTYGGDFPVGSSGTLPNYTFVSVVPPREVGLTLKYAFGSR